jgi:hypothetical protein
MQALCFKALVPLYEEETENVKGNFKFFIFCDLLIHVFSIHSLLPIELNARKTAINLKRSKRYNFLGKVVRF